MASPEETPKSERKKMIIAIVLGVGALFTLWYAFFGSTPKATSPQAGASNANRGTLAPRSPSATGAVDPAVPPLRRAGLREEELLLPPRPIPLVDAAPPAVPEASRNIFAYYVPPPKPVITPTPLPPPSPTPPPPLLVASVSPSNVYARTSEFRLDVSGDKFTPQARVYVEGRELATRYLSPQQLSATVPAAVIANEGVRQITVRTPDGTLYSNIATLNVSAPPPPNYTYVGLVGGPSYNDTAILKDKSSRNLVNVQRGDTVSGRFRVTSISQREVVLVDTNIKVRHTLPLTTESATPGGPQRFPQQPVNNNDEEPE